MFGNDSSVIDNELDKETLNKFVFIGLSCSTVQNILREIIENIKTNYIKYGGKFHDRRRTTNETEKKYLANKKSTLIVYLLFLETLEKYNYIYKEI